LRTAGISLQKIRLALKNVNKILGSKKNISDVSLFPVHTETEAEVFSLYPEKVSASSK